MNSLSGFNSQEIRRLHPYLSALLGRLKELETKVARSGDVVWGTDEDIQPTGNENLAGILNKFARADHQHLFKFPTAIPLSTPDGSAFFDLSASAINIYVGDTPTTRVVAGGTEGDVQPTGRRRTGEVPRYSFADHSHPTAVLSQGDTQTPVQGEIRVSADNKLVRWNGTEWIEVSVERVEAGTDADVRPTKRLSAGSAPRFARADHSHPTAILPQGDTQTPEADEIRYTADDKLVRWNASAGEWVPLSVETFTVEWGTDVEPTRLRSAGSSTRFARADHSHPTAILPQGNTQTPVADEIRFNADNKIVRWNGSAWVEMSVETVEAGTESDVQPTRLRSAGSSARFARADHSHPTALLPQSDTQTPVEDEIRYNTDNKIVRWDGSDWVPLSVETGGGEAGTDSDVQPTRLRNAGASTRYARADHSHPTAILPQGNSQTPVEDEIRYNTDDKLVRWNGTAWVPLSVETPEWGTNSDVQATGLRSAGTSTRVARADHSHPTVILEDSDLQPPVQNEIRFIPLTNKIVRWDNGAWIELSVETVYAGTIDEVQPTRLRSTGTSPRFARADHSHPTAILPQNDIQTPVADEIRYNTDNKLVRWNGEEWVALSVEALSAGLPSDVQPTGLKSEGTTTRYARANHSHPTAILAQGNSQVPVLNEIRYTGANRLVRWTGSGWADIIGTLPVPADPLVLPYDNQVSSPQNRQLVNHSSWDNIGNATVFYHDANNNQYRLIFARPLVVSTTSFPSGKDVWSNVANELVIKRGTGGSIPAGSVLWNRTGNTTEWSPVGIQLVSDGAVSFPTDVGVLSRTGLTGTSGSRRWFIRGAQEGGVFRAPFVGIATYTSSTVPVYTDLSTATGDGYGYFIYDIDRVDVVKPATNGNKYCTMLTHHIIAPVCRVFRTDADPSGHYVRDELWNGIWVVAFRTTTSATTNLSATLPTITVPIGTQAGRVLLYLHNPQSSAISTIFAVLVRTPTSTGISDATTSDTTVSIPANTTVIADLGHLSFPASTTLSHHRSFPITPIIIRRRANESANSNAVFCLAVVIVPQRAS